MNVLHRDSASLGAGNSLFGHENNVVRQSVRLCIFFNDIAYIIFVGDYMGADCKTLVFDAVHLDGFIFAFVYNIAFFAHVLQSFPKKQNRDFTQKAHFPGNHFRKRDFSILSGNAAAR